MGISRAIREQRNVELKGKKYFHLELIEPFFKESEGKQRAWWKCKCVCGNFIERAERVILTGNTKSCGCKHPRKYGDSMKGENHFNFRGHKGLHGRQLQILQYGAKTRGLEWAVTKEYLWELYEKQKGLCALSGIEIKFVSDWYQRKGEWQTASLDRIDPTKGYVEGNVQWIHKHINIMKNKYGDEYYIEMCNKVAKLHPR